MKTADEFGYPEVEKQVKAQLRSMLHDGRFGVVLKQPGCLLKSVLAVGPSIIDRFITYPKRIGWMRFGLANQPQRRLILMVCNRCKSRRWDVDDA